jgi:hypothetical protein
MKRKFQNRNEEGFYLISFAIVVVVFGAIATSVISTKTIRLQNSKAVIKAYFDAEVAIDLFGQQLRQAYDMAAPVAESSIPVATQNTFTTTLIATGLITHPSVNVTYIDQQVDQQTQVVTNTPVQVPLKFYLPNGGNKICVHRSDGSDINSSAGLICIILPNDFASHFHLNLDQNQNPVLQAAQLKYKNNDSTTTHEYFYSPTELKRQPSRMQALLSLINKSFAQSVEFSADPGPVSAAPAQVIPVLPVTVTNYNPGGNPAFQLRYGNNNCSATQTDRFCFSIKFCLKVLGSCAAGDPVVHQTYVFMKAPQSSLLD